MFHQSSVVLRFGEDAAPSISVRGDGYAVPSKKQVKSPGSLSLKGGIIDLSPANTNPVFTDCSCLRSNASNLSARNRRSNSLERRLANKFTTYNDREGQTEEEDDEDDALKLSTLIRTFKKFSGKHLNPLQARNIARLARGYNGKETLTRQDATHIEEFLDCDNPAIQEATLISLSRLIDKGEENTGLLFTKYNVIWDAILSLASDGPTVEVQIAAMKSIEKVTSHHEYSSVWEGPVEDIVYPLVHSIIKNRESTLAQKTSSLGIMRNLSHLPVFASLVKQDVVSQLLSVHDSSQMKGLYLLVLYENLKSSKQRISTDILDNALLPVLVSMLQDGPCLTQQQSLNLLKYFVEDEISRSSLLSTPLNTAFILLCAKYSHCRKVRALSLTILEKLMATQNVVQARQLMECNSECMALETERTARYISKEDRVSSPTRRKSRAEAQLWQHFDTLTDDLVGLLEREACIYHDQKHVFCGLSLIGSINTNQLTCISSLIGCFNKLCSWPIQRPRKLNGSLGAGDDEQAQGESWRVLASTINRHHALDVWTKVGCHVMAIFRQLQKRIPTTKPTTPTSKSKQAESELKKENPTDNRDNSSTSQQKSNAKSSSSINLSSFLHPEEYTLLTNLTEFIFIISLASCTFQNSPFQKDEEGSNEVKGEKGNRSVKRSKKEQVEREALTDRKFLRCHLVDEGVMLIVGQLLMHEDDVIKAMAMTTLRMCLQPMVDKDTETTKNIPVGQRHVSRTRPQSATGRLETVSRQTINQQVFQMGKPGVGSRPQSSIPYLTDRFKKAVNRPSSARTPQYIFSGDENNGTRTTSMSRPGSARPASTRPSSAKYEMFYPLTPRSERKQLYHRSGEPVSQLNDGSRSMSRSDRVFNTRSGKVVSFDQKEKMVKEISDCWLENDPDTELISPLNYKGNISMQCCHRSFLVAGETTLKGIFSKNWDVKRSCLLFLHDLVKYGTNDIHMKLSKIGCVSKLVDFLRVNDDDELLEVTGLIITQMMISSDRRLCHLFNRHGGTNVLMVLLKKYQGTPLKQEVCSTLNAVNNIMHSIPDEEEEELENRGPKDVWEHIMQRWTDEDEVVTVLKKFL